MYDVRGVAIVHWLGWCKLRARSYGVLTIQRASSTVLWRGVLGARCVRGSSYDAGRDRTAVMSAWLTGTGRRMEVRAAHACEPLVSCLHEGTTMRRYIDELDGSKSERVMKRLKRWWWWCFKKRQGAVRRHGPID